MATRRIILKYKESEEDLRRKERSREDTIFADLTIDKYNLDVEAATIGEKIRKYGLLFTRTKELRRRLSAELEAIEFEQSALIRRNPKEWGITKDTDTIVMKAVKTTDEWKEAYRKLNSVRRKEEDYSIVVDALKSNGFMIRTLTDQWLNDYFTQESQFERKDTKKTLRTSGINHRNNDENEDEDDFEVWPDRD